MNKHFWTSKIAVGLLFLMAFFNWPNLAFADTLTGVSVTLGSVTPKATTTHSVGFTTATEATLKQVTFQWEKDAGDSTKPTTLNLVNISIGSVSGLNSSNWTLDKASYNTGLIKYNNSDGESKTASSAISMIFSNVYNAEIGDCTVSGKMFDTCHLTIKTYSDAGTTLVDNATTSYQLEDVPSLTYKVEGVVKDTVTNNITTTIDTGYDEIAFGKMGLREVEYGAHRLYVETTAADGYSVTMKLDGYIQGLKEANKIDPFAAIDCTWTTPKPWTTPTGTEGSTDTGWIGANTSDTRVNGWSTDSGGKFGHVSSTAHEVMKSTGKDYGTYKYVTYALEVNEYQPYDSYAGILIYEVTPTY